MVRSFTGHYNDCFCFTISQSKNRCWACYKKSFDQCYIFRRTTGGGCALESSCCMNQRFAASRDCCRICCCWVWSRCDGCDQTYFYIRSFRCLEGASGWPASSPREGTPRTQNMRKTCPLQRCLSRAKRYTGCGFYLWGRCCTPAFRISAAFALSSCP